MSALPASPMPPPRQKPCTAAITGTCALVHGGERLVAAAVDADDRLAGRPASSLMSTPAQKPRPSARRMTTRTSGSAPAERTTSASSNQPCDGQRVDRRDVDDDVGDVLGVVREMPIGSF